ncbi:MAG: DUF3782 domain-containing protein [Euryarchaeota archaeon]|nr:DUF3782 domain-containing protein [Euryarchaeota archaeon]
MCASAESLSSAEFEDMMRQKLPDLLRKHAAFRYEIMDIMADVFASRDNFERILEEIKELREDGNRQFEEMNRRFERVDQRFERIDQRFEKVDQRFEEMNRTMDRRFEEMYRSQQEIRLEVSALGGRVGRGLEEIIKQTVEEFSGQTFKKIEHMWLRDEEGELYGVPADVEYDLYLEDTVNYVVEVKSHTKLGDVFNFHRKSAFAEKCLEKKIQSIIISVSITESAKKKCKELGIDLIARSVV